MKILDKYHKCCIESWITFYGLKLSEIFYFKWYLLQIFTAMPFNKYFMNNFIFENFKNFALNF